MAVYDFYTIRNYHEKRLRLINCAVPLREEFIEIWRSRHIQKDCLDMFAMLKEPYYDLHFKKFYTGKMTNFNTIYNSVNRVVFGKFAKPEYDGMFNDFYSHRLIPIKSEREKHIERLQMLKNFCVDDEFEILDTGGESRKAINYIDRFVKKA